MKCLGLQFQNALTQQVRMSERVIKAEGQYARPCPEESPINVSYQPWQEPMLFAQNNPSTCKEWRGGNNKHANVLPFFTNRFVYFFSRRMEEIGIERQKQSLIISWMNKANLKSIYSKSESIA